MLPELAISYVVGATSSVSLSGLHIFLYRKKIGSHAFKQLQANLNQCGLYWSDIESQIKPGTNEDTQSDHNKYIKSVLLSGAIFAALTWLGFILQFLMMFSIRYLTISRQEIRIFSSDLSKKIIPPEQVRTLVDELTNLV
jgi:uncharacterized membrane protein YvbJ